MTPDPPKRMNQEALGRELSHDEIQDARYEVLFALCENRAAPTLPPGSRAWLVAALEGVAVTASRANELAAALAGVIAQCLGFKVDTPSPIRGRFSGPLWKYGFLHQTFLVEDAHVGDRMWLDVYAPVERWGTSAVRGGNLPEWGEFRSANLSHDDANDWPPGPITCRMTNCTWSNIEDLAYAPGIYL